MKRLFLLILIFCSFLTAKAQLGGGPSITGKISGTVVDSLSKKPLDYATVSIFRTRGKAPITGVLTDEKGGFKLNNIAPGNYKIVISYIGYPSKTIDPVTTTLSKPDHNMGSVILAPSAKTLSQVNIVGQQSVIETKIDKIVYNVEKDLTAVGGNASDVLRKVPLVAVDINGNVSLRGDQNVKVLINGKPSGAMSNNLADVLKSFPADQIKNIEVITAPSAKYDAEGSAGIINIVTKSKNISGVSGGISGGFGTRQNNGNANLSIKQNRLSVSGNFGGNFTWPQVTPTTFFNHNDSTLTTNTQKSTSTIKRYAYTGAGSLSYDFNNYNSITSNIRFNQGGFRTDGNGNTVIASPDKKTTAIDSILYATTSNTHTVFGGFDWDAGYTHKFKKEGHELSIDGQWSHSTTTVDYGTFYQGQVPGANQTANNSGVNNEYTAQLDYSLPVSKNVKLEAGGKSIFRVITSTSDFFTQNGAGNPFVYSPTLSNGYDYNQDVYAGYTVFTFTLPKSFTLQTGARVENTQIDGKPGANSTGQTPFSSSYTTFVPSFAISKTINNTQTFKLSYSKRIQRPSLQYLNPFLNQTNILSQSRGNPQLSPEVSQTVELNYNTFIKSSVINASIYYRHTSSIIESLLTPIDIHSTTDTTVLHGTLTNYANVGSNNSWGASFFGSVNPVKILTIRASINAFTYSPSASGAYQAQQSSNGTYIMYNIFGSGSLTLPKDIALETFAILNSPRRTIQGSNPSFGFIGFGVRKQLMNKRASIGFNTLSPFKNTIDFNQDIVGKNFTQSSHTAFPFRSFGLTFSYNFGKISVKPDNPMQQQNKGLNDDLKQGDQGGQGGGR
ncbi:outer membrane receptor protein involved in Fe transport [Mucilaginibacter yixingensis]|uniref:Outer membrane receptor protein involved in Fe transport n=1 Tax=Mucilaginibacter yixingensis TaxID=1295612 RepID=A0A2T5JBT2_9SPHI|nr:outer membrane beta-barrel family protein [Mucilaginibacter yixingensis]PTQ99231.1 outer membrane receptor protein involved in Fe transport [Mucilaginibacter yixingensis]